MNEWIVEIICPPCWLVSSWFLYFKTIQTHQFRKSANKIKTARANRFPHRQLPVYRDKKVIACLLSQFLSATMGRKIGCYHIINRMSWDWGKPLYLQVTGKSMWRNPMQIQNARPQAPAKANNVEVIEWLAVTTPRKLRDHLEKLIQLWTNQTAWESKSWCAWKYAGSLVAQV